MLRSIGSVPGNPWSQSCPEEEKVGYGGKDLQKEREREFIFHIATTLE